jgi:hypothetical protein
MKVVGETQSLPLDLEFQQFKNILRKFVKKIMALCAVYLLLAPILTLKPCCRENTVIEMADTDPSVATGLLEMQEAVNPVTYTKNNDDQVWLLFIEGVGIYRCLAHPARGCQTKSAHGCEENKDVEYILFGGMKMHVTLLLELINDKNLNKDLLRSQTPDSFGRTEKAVQHRLKHDVTACEYPVIRVRNKKKRWS